ncbi:MAG: hypothetical protein RJA61_317 [Candidatus Parcubacteria bacterium]|jgi:hypothetical protein
MDETQKLIEAPHRSKKTLYLFLILIFLVALVSLMFFNKNRDNESNLTESVIVLTPEEEQETLTKIDTTVVPIDISNSDLVKTLKEVDNSQQVIKE